MRAAAHDAHPCASPDGRLSAVQIGYPADLSLNADVTVPAWDRAGLERLLRYCARPIFASERLQWIKKDQQLVYRLPKARPNGQTVLHLTPLEFLDKLAVLIPPPRKHRHRYHGVLAPDRLRRLHHPGATRHRLLRPVAFSSEASTTKDTLNA